MTGAITTRATPVVLSLPTENVPALAMPDPTVTVTPPPDTENGAVTVWLLLRQNCETSAALAVPARASSAAASSPVRAAMSFFMGRSTSFPPKGLVEFSKLSLRIRFDAPASIPNFSAAEQWSVWLNFIQKQLKSQCYTTNQTTYQKSRLII